MRKFTEKSGFTLIEIIVVLIIVGILAAIALPNLFSNIQKSKGGQALATMDSYKTSLEACATANSGVAVGTAPCTIAGQNLTSNINSWTFTTAAGAGSYGANTLTYQLVAKDDPGGNTITLTRLSAPWGSWTCSATGPYTGIC